MICSEPAGDMDILEIEVHAVSLTYGTYMYPEPLNSEVEATSRMDILNIPRLANRSWNHASNVHNFRNQFNDSSEFQQFKMKRSSRNTAGSGACLLALRVDALECVL